MDKIIYIILLVFSALGTLFGFRAGKTKKENEIMKNNNNLKKKYLENRLNNKKGYINDSKGLSEKLNNGKY